MGSIVSVRMAFNVDVYVTHCEVAFIHTIILLTVDTRVHACCFCVRMQQLFNEAVLVNSLQFCFTSVCGTF